MRTARHLTRWLETAIIALAMVGLALPVSAQDDVAPEEGQQGQETGDEGGAEEAAPAEEGVEDEIDEATQAEIDAALAEDAPHCNGTGVEGVVRDAQTGETLIEAPVIVMGRGTRVLTDYDGRFAIDLPPGTYSLRSYYDLYEPTRVDDIVVRRGDCTRIDIELATQTTEGEEIVIEVRGESGSEASQLRLRRESASVQDGVSAEEIRRSPDSDAGQAARRIVGASVVGGQYLFVRGLGGRYTAVLLNGAFLPSSDPDQPGVQLDLFPAALLNSLTVAKTFTPDMPGDAAGGTMLIQTREFPSRFQLGVSASLALNTESSFQNAPVGTGGGLDALGYDDGTRALPGTLLANRPLLLSRDVTAEQLFAAGRGFQSNWAISEQLVGPNGRLSLNFGDTLLLGDRRLGYFVTVGYGNSSQVLRGERLSRAFLRNPATGEIGAIPDRFRTSFTNQIQWGALLTSQLEVSDKDEIAFTFMWTQNAESYTGVITGEDADNDRLLRQSRIRWVERALYFGQLSGEHRALPFNARLRWQLSGSLSNRSEPDTRDLIYIANRGSDSYFWFNSPGSGERLYLGLDQQEVGSSFDLSIPIETATLRFGAAFRAAQRTFQLRRFIYLPCSDAVCGNEFDPSNGGMPPQDLFEPANIGQEVFMIETTGGFDSYSAYQGLSAGFAMLDWQIVPWLRGIAGARVEGFRQVVESRSPFNPELPPSRRTARTDLDPLFSASLVFTLVDDMYLRASYGGTVARPQIRELAPFTYPDFIRVRNIEGFPGLQRARLDNVDLRWEYYLSPTEVIAVSGFFKNFENPIEMVAFANNTFSFRNALGAINLGGEVEARMNFRRFHDILAFLDVGVNLTLVYSEVRLSEEERGQSTSVSRPLAGQSPYVINASIGFSPPDSGFSLRLFYNVFGERIIEVGRELVPDIYQQPMHSFDVTAMWQFHPMFELRAAVENIFYDDFVLTQGGFVIQQYNQGLTGSLSLSWRPE